MKLVAVRGALVAVLASTAPWAAHAITPALQELQDAFIRIGDEVRPCVVNIDAEREESEESGPHDVEEFFRLFGIPMPEDDEGLQTPRPRRQPRLASGSGFVWDAEGHIVTNNHVVEDSSSLVVRMSDGKSYDATVVGVDADTDIAVIKMVDPPAGLRPAELGDSEGLRVGQFAIALGSPRGFEGSLSFGHVSALGRDELELPTQIRFQNFIQTDAAINLGNSGGPLCDIEGRVIGINTAIVWGAESLGFAIPINTAKSVVPQLIGQGKVTRGFLGVDDIKDIATLISGSAKIEDVLDALGMPDAQGAYVNGGSLPNSPAEKAGIKANDVIRKVNGERVIDAKDLVNKISSLQPGDSIQLELWRDKQPMEVQVTLAEYPGSVLRARLGEPVLGMSLKSLTPEEKRRLGMESDENGVLVMDVEADSPADAAEIAPGDVIQQVDQHSVNSVDEVRKTVKEIAKPGSSLLLRVKAPDGRAMPKVVKIPEGYTP